MSDIEDTFAYQIKVAGLPEPVREYKFHPTRKWKFDFAWICACIKESDDPTHVAVEIEGGTWMRGRHTRPAGFANDCEKYNEATRLGWQVYRFTSAMVYTGEALEFMEEVLR
jgi:hypothetical protein